MVASLLYGKQAESRWNYLNVPKKSAGVMTAIERLRSRVRLSIIGNDNRRTDLRLGKGRFTMTDKPKSQDDGAELDITAERVAREFHERYEQLAPQYGYETRKESRVPWPPPNADLMIAVVRPFVERARAAEAAAQERILDLEVAVEGCDIHKCDECGESYSSDALWGLDDRGVIQCIDCANKAQLKRIAELEQARDSLEWWVRQLAGAPDSQVSSFVRSACAAVLDGADAPDIPPGDPYKIIAELEAERDELREQAECWRMLMHLFRNQMWITNEGNDFWRGYAEADDGPVVITQEAYPTPEDAVKAAYAAMKEEDDAQA